jgi:hypothetical protein
MQNSELYRRGFVVPLNKETELALVNNNVNEQTDVDFLKLLMIKYLRAFGQKDSLERSMKR